MVERFNALARRESIDFEAWFNSESEPGRSWDVNESDWKFPYRYLPAGGIGPARDTFPLPLLGRRLPHLLISLYAAPSFVVGSAIARRRGIRVAYWCEVTFST